MKIFIIIFIIIAAISLIIMLFSIIIAILSDDDCDENDDKLYLCASVQRLCAFYDRGKCNNKCKCKSKYLK